MKMSVIRRLHNRNVSSLYQRSTSLPCHMQSQNIKRGDLWTEGVGVSKSMYD